MAEVGNPGSTATGLPSTTARQSGFPGLSATPWTRMPGCAQLRHRAVGQIARALGRPAGEHDHVADRERAAHGTLERRLVVGNGAEGNRLAAGFRDRGRDDGAVAVVDLCRGERRGPARSARRRSKAPPLWAGGPPRSRRCRRPRACRSRATRRGCCAATSFRRVRYRSPHRRRIVRARPRGARRLPARRRPRSARCARS